jgi:hypothetical protein
VLGGVAERDGPQLDSAELYDDEPRSDTYRTWAPADHMAAARADIAGSVSRSTGGDVVVAGDAPTVETFDRFSMRFGTLLQSGHRRRLATATALPFTTLLAGGFDAERRPSAEATLIAP